MVAPARAERVAQLEAEATLVRLMSMHFMELPDTSFVAKLREGPFEETLRIVASDRDGDEGIKEGARLMAGFLSDSAEMTDEDLRVVLGVDRTRLYRGVTPQYSPPYPAEAVWRGLEGQQAAEFVERLVEEYRASGFALQEGSNERPDYFGIELEFVRTLCLEEREALGANELSRASAVSQARGEFCERHLVWAAAFADAAAPYAQTDFYRGHLKMLASYCR